jgi:hypothetical protein
MKMRTEKRWGKEQAEFDAEKVLAYVIEDLQMMKTPRRVRIRGGKSCERNSSPLIASHISLIPTAIVIYRRKGSCL